MRTVFRGLFLQFHGNLVAFVLLLLPLNASHAHATKVPPKAQKGHLDLSHWDFTKQGNVSLQGEWQFHKKQFTIPTADERPTTRPDRKQSKVYLQVPGSWQSLTLKKAYAQKLHWGTYQLRLTLPVVGKAMALRLMDIHTAYKCFINGQLVETVGNPSSIPENYSPRLEPKRIYFQPQKKEILLTIWVANASLPQGGLINQIQLGYAHQINREQQRQSYFEVFLLGLLLVMAFYHFGLYSLRKQELSTLFFGLLCLIIAIRTLHTGERLGFNWFFPWAVAYRIDLGSFYIAVPLFCCYIRELFPLEVSKYVVRGTMFVGAIALVSLLTPSLYLAILVPYQIFTLLFGLYVLLVLAMANIHNRTGARLTLVGVAICLLTVLNDVLMGNGIIHTGYVVPFGVSCLILSQAHLLSQRLSFAFQKVETLSEQISSNSEQLKEESTIRKKAEKKAQESQDRYRELVEDITEVIFEIGADGVIKYISPAVKRVMGYSPEELKSKSYLEHVYAEDIPMMQANFQRVLSGYFRPREYRLLAKSGECRWIRSSSKPIIQNGQAVGIRGIFFDITNEKHLQAELLQARKMETVGTLAGGIAHDFNNILSMILGNAELALFDLKEDDPVHESITEIKTVFMRASGIVQQLLNFSRKSSLEFKNIDAIQILDEALSLLRVTIPAHIELQKEFAEDSISILADPIQIHQVLMNICTNASQAMEDSGGILTIKAYRYQLTEQEGTAYQNFPKAEYLKIQISDTGPGIKDEIIDRIFDPYFTTKKLGKGTGMGLAIVHGIVTKHDGVIRVESLAGKGTTFTILIPTVSKEPTPEHDEPTGIAHGSEHILIVDDEEKLSHTTARVLQKFGYRVTPFTNPEEALSAFRQTPQAFDLVISDMTMPQMTGDKLLLEMMAIRPELPTVICTGHSPLINKEKAKSLGIAKLIMKPIKVEKLAQKIRKVLEKHKQKS